MKQGFLFLALMTFISCSFFRDKVDKEELPGRYVFQIDNNDTLNVYTDGTYSFYKTSSGRKLQNSGRWTYNSNVGEMNFNNFSFLTHSISIGDSTFFPRGSWITRVEKDDDEIRFIYASDVYNGYFLKIDLVNVKK
jgi:hypothetical protein